MLGIAAYFACWCFSFLIFKFLLNAHVCELTNCWYLPISENVYFWVPPLWSVHGMETSHLHIHDGKMAATTDSPIKFLWWNLKYSTLPTCHQVWSLLVPQNIRIDTIFQDEYFEVLKSTVNGSHHYVRTKQSGITEINAALVAVVRPVSIILFVICNNLL